MTTYFFVLSPAESVDGIIATANNGSVFTENRELHLRNETYHFIHKFNGEPIGWNMRNPTTGIDYFLGQGGTPTITFDDMIILDGEYWEQITYVPEGGADE